VIIPATEGHLRELTALFTAYREFYGLERRPDESRAFLNERLAQEDAAIFLAVGVGGEAAGFTLLYPSWSSLGLGRTWILNDLFVAPEQRQKGFATALLRHARQFGASTGARSLFLQTAVTNTAAQALYAAEGWTRHDDFLTFTIKTGG
jgi:ribosomal protein S18 acetylase RimI-like enzyme